MSPSLCLAKMKDSFPLNVFILTSVDQVVVGVSQEFVSVAQVVVNTAQEDVSVAQVVGKIGC